MSEHEPSTCCWCHPLVVTVDKPARVPERTTIVEKTLLLTDQGIGYIVHCEPPLPIGDSRHGQ